MALISSTIYHQRDAETPVTLWLVSEPGDLSSLIAAKEGDIGFVLDGSIYRRDISTSGWSIKFDPSVGGGGSVWGSITGTLGDQSDLSSALGGKAASSHTHIEGDITGLTADLAGKAALSHTHTIADITDLQVREELHASGSVSSSGNNTCITPTAGKKIRLGYVSYNPALDVEAAFRFGAAGTLFLRNSITADSVIAKDYGDWRYVEGEVDEPLILNLSDAVSVIWNAFYTEET